MITHLAHNFYPNSPSSITVSQGATFVVVLVHSTLSGQGITTMPSATLGGESGSLAGGTAYDRCNIDVWYFLNPSEGELAFVPTFSPAAPAAGYLLEVFEYSDVSSIADFSALTYGGSTPTATKAVPLNGVAGKFAIISGSSRDDNAINTAPGVPDAGFTEGFTTIDGQRQVVSGYVSSLASNSESFELTFNDDSAGGGAVDGYVTVAFTLVEAVNQAPIADDDTFSVPENVQNGATVGTFTATDSDGTIASYSITGTTLAIDNAGVITIADNTGITEGVDITATVTATDDDGATDTAVITVTVTGPAFSESAPFAVTYNPPTGYSVVELTGIDENSWLNDPQYIGNAGGDANNIGVGDQLVYKSTTNEDGTAVTVSSVGLPEMPDAVADGVTTNQTINWFYLDAQDNYAAGPEAVLTLIAPESQSEEDTTAPVITLLGSGTVTHAQGSTYTDAGATASDNTDGDITGDIVVTGSVDTNTVGSYVLSYNVTDAAGNVAATVTRTVNVTDQSVPVITLTGEANITLTEGDSYAEQGATWTDNVDGSGAAVVGGDTVDTTTPGVYTVTYDYTDAAGNVATQVTRTITVEAEVDATAPVITLLGNASVTITEGQTYTDAGATAADNVDGDLTGSIVTVNPVNTGVPGNYTVTYNVSDAAGNAATQVSRTVTVEAAQQQVTAPTESVSNPLPATVYVRNGTSYDFSQHVVNPDGAILNYALAQGSPALPEGVSLNATTGVLSTNTNQYTPVSGLSIEVTLA